MPQSPPQRRGARARARTRSARRCAPLRGAPSFLRRRWRSAASSGSCVASRQVVDLDALRQPLAAGRADADERHAARAAPRPPAPAWRATWSQASITRVHRLRQQRRPVVRRRRTRRPRARRSRGGCRRCARAAPAPWPARACAPSAWTWRLMFDSATWSRSISISARDAAARQRLGGPRADAAEADDRDTRARAAARSRRRRTGGAGRRSGARGRRRQRGGVAAALMPLRSSRQIW